MIKIACYKRGKLTVKQVLAINELRRIINSFFGITERPKNFPFKLR